MFPFRDHNPTGRTPYVTYALIAANISVFLLMVPYMGDDKALFKIYLEWGLVPNWIVNGDELTSIFTSMFLHGGFMHLAGNMLFLWIFGDNLEDELGHFGFVIFYLVSGVGAAALQILPDPDSLVPMIGASGAIAGIMGGYLLLFPKARVDVLLVLVVFFKVIPVPAWIMLLIWLGIQIFNGVITAAGDAGVAYWAHAGGFIVGFVWVIPVWLRRGGTVFWSQTRGKPPHPEARYRINDSRIPLVKRQKR